MGGMDSACRTPVEYWWLDQDGHWRGLCAVHCAERRQLCEMAGAEQPQRITDRPPEMPGGFGVTVFPWMCWGGLKEVLANVAEAAQELAEVLSANRPSAPGMQCAG